MQTIFAKDAGGGAAAPRSRARRIRHLPEHAWEKTSICFGPCQCTAGSDGAFAKMMCIPNQDEDTEKQAAFVLRHQNHVTLDLGGSLLVRYPPLFPHAPAFDLRGIVHQEVQM